MKSSIAIDSLNLLQVVETLGQISRRVLLLSETIVDLVVRLEDIMEAQKFDLEVEK